MRYFLALPIKPIMKNDIFAIQSQLKKSWRINAAWVMKENLHLTIKFWGQLDRSNADDIEKSLQAIINNNISNIACRLTTLGVFPNKKNPRVIWIGLAGEIEKIHNLYIKCEKISRDLGMLQSHTAFTPHITLARIKENIVLTDETLAGFPLQTKEVSFDKAVLYHSTLTSRGPVYRVVEVFPFSG
ncbi:MAG: RNA 2',3'-cyclic phosphodiesterase [Peptococcaceae bacterium]